VTFTGALGAVRPYNSAGPPKTVSMCKSKYWLVSWVYPRIWQETHQSSRWSPYSMQLRLTARKGNPNSLSGQLSLKTNQGESKENALRNPDWVWVHKYSVLYSTKPLSLSLPWVHVMRRVPWYRVDMSPCIQCLSDAAEVWAEGGGESWRL
jgi:hypothetical protein